MVSKGGKQTLHRQEQETSEVANQGKRISSIHVQMHATKETNRSN